MDVANVTLFVVPSAVRVEDLLDYDIDQIGDGFSNLREINVNKVDDGYSLIFENDIFVRLDLNRLSRRILDLFTKNLPTTRLDVSIVYLYELDDEDEDDPFDMKTAEAVLQFEASFRNALASSSLRQVKMIRYRRTQNIVDVAEEFRSGLYSYKHDEEEDDEPITAIDDLRRHLGLTDDDDDDDEDDYDDYPSHKSRRYWDDGYGASKVLRSAKNPKRVYHRHGIIVARNKEMIRKDRKIIKRFLKDFIPGDSQWQKDLRNDLADRWIKMYTMTSKQLKKLEKAHRRQIHEQYRPKIDTEKVLGFARSMVSTPIDNWSNPNK